MLAACGTWYASQIAVSNCCHPRLGQRPGWVALLKSLCRVLLDFVVFFHSKSLSHVRVCSAHDGLQAWDNIMGHAVQSVNKSGYAAAAVAGAVGVVAAFSESDPEHK